MGTNCGGDKRGDGSKSESEEVGRSGEGLEELDTEARIYVGC